MILHLLTDDKFADYVIKQFSDRDALSEFVLIPTNNHLELVKEIDKCNIIYPNSTEFTLLLNNLDRYTGIMFHGLFWGKWQTPILEKIPSRVKVLWYFWGGEIYSRADMFTANLAPKTKLLYNIRRILKRNNIDSSWEIPSHLFKKVDYFSTSIKEEYDYVKQYTGASFEHLWYTCYSIEDTVGPLKDCCCEGTNVMIGNSSSIKNNYIDVFWEIIKSKTLKNLRKSKVIIPLSYGEVWHRNLIMKIGKVLFGKQMQALVTFMPLNEYNTLMLSCSTIILGYTQPAGQGNIITALWLGMRVYLSEKSLAFTFFKRVGAKVFSLESELRKYQFTPLSEEEREENKRVLYELYSKQNVMDAVKNIINALQ